MITITIIIIIMTRASGFCLSRISVCTACSRKQHAAGDGAAGVGGCGLDDGADV